MADVYLTQRDIDYISRVVATEVPASIARTDPEEYSRMVNAVVDTMVNRVASESYPDTITGVANQSRQFSKITGPARLDPYGSVQSAPKASQAVQSAVAGRIADLAQGADSEIDGALSYANPNFSDASNLASWINPMIEAGAVKLGLGDSVHFHGLAPGQQPVDNVNVTAEGIPSGGIPVPYGPNDDPFALSAQAQAIDGFSGLANPVSARETVAMNDLPAVERQPGEWGVLNGVAPALIPTMNSWAPVAAAEPVAAPMGSVQAQGVLSGVPAQEASATVGTIPDSVTVSSRMGIAEPGFDESRLDGLPVSVASNFDNGRFANPLAAAFDQSRFGAPAIDPATNVASFADQPSAIANTSNLASGVMAQRDAVAPSPGVMAGIDTRGFDASRFGPDMASFDQSRFGDAPAATFDEARLGPALVDPATNVASFVDQPADLGSMPDAYAAQRQAPTGLNSAEMDAMRGHVAYQQMKDLQDRQLNSFPSTVAATPAFNVPASGVLAGVPGMEAQAVANVPSQNAGVLANPSMATPNFAQAVNPSLPSLASTPVGPSQYQMQEINKAAQIPGVIAAGLTPAAVTAYTDEPAPDPAVAAIEAQADPSVSALATDPLASAEQQAAGYQQFAVAAPQITNLSGTTGIWDDGTAYSNLPAAAAQIPDLQQTDDAAAIEGPATTPADEQQAQTDAKTAITAPATTTATTKTAPVATNKGVLSGLFSKEALGGGVLAGLMGGPVAAPLGVLAGMAVANGGGLTGLLSPTSFSQPTNQIAGGVNNISGIYNGAQPAGTYAVANNGATITAQPGGYTTYTNKYGTTNAVGPDGKISGYFGSGAQPTDPDKDNEASTNSGGFFGGLFG